MSEQNQAEDKSSTTVKDTRKRELNVQRPWGVFAGLSIGAIVIVAIIWIGALFFSNIMVNQYARNHADHWSQALIQNLSDKHATFANQSLTINDKYTLKDFQKGTNIFRFSLMSQEGRVFWSSTYEQIGKVEKRPFIKSAISKGRPTALRTRFKASQIDGLTMQKHVNRSDENSLRDTIQIAVPVKNQGNNLGAIIINEDITSMVVWSKTKAQTAAFALSGTVLIIFVAIAALIWKYGTDRLKQTRALIAAKQKADDASQKAVTMADQLQVMNNDIIELNKELQANVKTLRETQEEVIRKGKMAQLGQLTATVAHDIRNPLGSVRTSAFLLRRKFADQHPAMAKPIERIEKGVERCDGIISELLDFARSKDLTRKEQSFDDWLVKLLREQSEQMPQEIAFECTLGVGDKAVSFDADSMSRAIINFLSNAAEAMVGKGADRPDPPTKAPMIKVASKLTDRGMEISVTDNGPGISPENIQKILDPLFTTKSFGVGLGLPAVEKIFEQHGGGMEISSEPGKGATFTGWFPLNQGKAENKVA